MQQFIPRTLKLSKFVLEGGFELRNIDVVLSTYGTLDASKSNVVWVCHALTANSDVLSWWKELFEHRNLFDFENNFVVCVNSIGSCYGTVGPTSRMDESHPMLERFPLVTTRDAANLFDEVREVLGLKTIKTLIGASLGGQQALEWSIVRPEAIKNLILIATNAKHSSYGIAFNESQRLAIYNDSTFGNGDVDGCINGLKTARSIALLSYRTYQAYAKSQIEITNENVCDFRAASYQRYQGTKLATRFNAYSYLCLLNMMDSHNVARGRESISKALARVKANTLVVSISSDQLFPVGEQRTLVNGIENAVFATIDSEYGHDGFLTEVKKLCEIFYDFLFNDFKNNKPTMLKQMKSE